MSGFIDKVMTQKDKLKDEMLFISRLISLNDEKITKDPKLLVAFINMFILKVPPERRQEIAQIVYKIADSIQAGKVVSVDMLKEGVT